MYKVSQAIEQQSTRNVFGLGFLASHFGISANEMHSEKESVWNFAQNVQREFNPLPKDFTYSASSSFFLVFRLLEQPF